MKSPEKNYASKGWQAALLLIALLMGISLIPPHSVGGVTFRRANILSDLISFEQTQGEAAIEQALILDEEEYQINLDEVAEQVGQLATELPSRPQQTTHRWVVEERTPQPRRCTPRGVQEGYPLTPIEQSDSTLLPSFSAFCDTLLNAQRPVRIAFLGDSFVEGDILTADLREQLQAVYGGGGAGFAPFASPLTAFRRTIKTQSKGWSTYNIMQRRSAPEALRSRFFLSGWLCLPASDASTRWEMTSYCKGLERVTSARILFSASHKTRIEITLNDTLRHEVHLAGEENTLRQIEVVAPKIASLDVRLLAGEQGFVGYGAIFEAEGVGVDNYSVRSNNGQALFWTNPSINAQANALGGYDLVVLQYGLNIMQSGVKDYSPYGRQIEKMVAFAHECFPQAAILVLGVSDRSVKTERGFEPMDALPYMLAHQREAALRSGASFWPICEAMRAEGGMEGYVKNGWAGKDYTHINYAGGKRVALALFEAINAECARRYDAQRIIARKAEERAFADSLRQIQGMQAPSLPKPEPMKIKRP